jgi:hypothetical protein
MRALFTIGIAAMFLRGGVYYKVTRWIWLGAFWVLWGVLMKVTSAEFDWLVIAYGGHAVSPTGVPLLSAPADRRWIVGAWLRPAQRRAQSC